MPFSSVNQSRHWKEFIVSLSQRRVRFVVVGAHALAVLGKPRYTADLDIFICPTRSNIEKLAEAMDDFGFAATDSLFALLQPNKMVVLGAEPNQIDILSSISGLSFEQAWAGRIKRKMAGHTVNFLGQRAFEINKRASGRPKDLLDLQLLREARPKRRRR